MGNGWFWDQRFKEESSDIRLRKDQLEVSGSHNYILESSESSFDLRTLKSQVNSKVKFSMKPTVRYNKSIKYTNQNDSQNLKKQYEKLRLTKNRDSKDISTDFIEIEQSEAKVEGRANRLRLIVNEIIDHNHELISNPSNIKIKWWK